MADLKIGKSMADDDVLWRYVPLEGLINMLESQSLHFSPLEAYQNTDPFEGYVPKVAMDAMASISSNTQKLNLATIERLERHVGPNLAPEKISELREAASQFKKEMGNVVKKVVKCLTVNCWHRNQHESEAMWRLYSHSGVAIRTTVSKIRASLHANKQPHIVHMGAIKYLDFADSTLSPPDCVTDDGQLFGMIKRIAYSHENEVRMYITGNIDTKNYAAASPEPISLDIDAMTLIDSLVISPFASTSMRKSIQAIAKKYGIASSKLIESPLLENCEYLFGSYND